MASLEALLQLLSGNQAEAAPLSYQQRQKAAMEKLKAMDAGPEKLTEANPQVEPVTKIEADPINPTAVIYDSKAPKNPRITSDPAMFTKENYNTLLPQIAGSLEDSQAERKRLQGEADTLKGNLDNILGNLQKDSPQYVSDYKPVIEKTLAQMQGVKTPDGNPWAEVATAFLPALLGSGLGFGGVAGAQTAAQVQPMANKMILDGRKERLDQANKLRESLIKQVNAYIGADKVARESFTGEQKAKLEKAMALIKSFENSRSMNADQLKQQINLGKELEQELNKYNVRGIDQTAQLQQEADALKEKREGRLSTLGRLNKPTEGEKKAAGFLGVARNAEKTLQSFGNTYPSEKTKWFDLKMDVEHGKSGVSSLIKGTNLALPTPEERKQMQAEIEWGTAILRNDSGAQITPSEAAGSAPQYFPRFGDTPQIIAQKAAARRQKENALLSQSGIAPQSAQADRPDLKMTTPLESTRVEATAKDKAAIDWVKKNPKDPKADQMKKILQKKGLM